MVSGDTLSAICILGVCILVASVLVYAYLHDQTECKVSCKELNMSYFKFELGGLLGGTEECWCRVGNRTVQVW